MTDTKQPRLTIGLPVHNAERFLRFTLDALLAQTFPHFELIISDDASTDATRRILQDYTARDARVRVVRNLEQIGLRANANRLVGLARGEYFLWALAGDIHSPDFLDRCITVLDRQPEVILCYTRADRISSAGKLSGAYDCPACAAGAAPHQRLASILRHGHACMALFGVARREVLASTRLFSTHADSDHLLMAELALIGRMHEISDFLLHIREAPAAGENNSLPNETFWRRATDANGWWAALTGSLPLARLVMASDLPALEKMRCIRAIGDWLVFRRVTAHSELADAPLSQPAHVPGGSAPPDGMLTG